MRKMRKKSMVTKVAISPTVYKLSIDFETRERVEYVMMITKRFNKMSSIIWMKNISEPYITKVAKTKRLSKKVIGSSITFLPL